MTDEPKRARRRRDLARLKAKVQRIRPWLVGNARGIGRAASTHMADCPGWCCAPQWNRALYGPPIREIRCE